MGVKTVTSAVVTPAPAWHRSWTNRWSMLAVLSVARVAMGVQFQAIASSAPSLRADLGLDPSQIGSLIGAYMLPGIVIALPGGLLARRLGEKWTCLLGLAFMAAGGFLMGNASSFAGLAVGRALSGGGAVIFNLVLTSMVAGWFAGAEIVTAMAILVASWPVAIAAALIGETALSLRYGWGVVAYAVAALCVAAWGAVALLYSARPDALARDESRDRPAVSRFELAACGFAGLLWGAFNAGLVIFYSFTPQLLIQRGWLPVQAGSATSVGLWITIISIPLGGWVVEALRRPNAGIVVSCIGAATFLGALPVVPWPMILALGVGLAIGLGGGAIVGLPARMIAPDHRPLGFGVFYTGYYGVMAFGPSLAGWAQDQWGSNGAPLLVGCGLFLAGLPLLAAATAGASIRQVGTRFAPSTSN